MSLLAEVMRRSLSPPSSSPSLSHLLPSVCPSLSKLSRLHLVFTRSVSRIQENPSLDPSDGVLVSADLPPESADSAPIQLYFPSVVLLLLDWTSSARRPSFIPASVCPSRQTDGQRDRQADRQAVGCLCSFRLL